MALLESADQTLELLIVLHLIVDLGEELAVLLAQLLGREDQPGRGTDALERGDRRHRELGVGEIVRHEQSEPGGGMPELREPVLHELQRIGRDLRPGLPDRQRVDQLGAVAADGHADRAGVRGRHRDRMHPGGIGDLVLLDQLDDRGREALPLEVGLEPGEQQERLAELVLGQVERELRGLVLGQVVVLERHDRAAGPVVEQGVGVEGDDLAHVEGGQQVVAELADGIAGIRESGQARHQVQAARDGAHLEGEVVQPTGIDHGSSLKLGPRRMPVPTPARREADQRTAVSVAEWPCRNCRSPQNPPPRRMPTSS